MRTAVGAPNPGDWSSQQPHNIFNDRRIGGKSKNRAVGESLYNPKMMKKEPAPHASDKWHTIQPKPKPPKKTWR